MYLNIGFSFQNACSLNYEFVEELKLKQLKT